METINPEIKVDSVSQSAYGVTIYLSNNKELTIPATQVERLIDNHSIKFKTTRVLKSELCDK